jgi:DNA-directed RNA polymerase subunit M/transcription elongation factor TFIIS
MTGKQHSEDTKKKMSNNMKGARGPQTRLEKCTKCGNTNVTYRHIKFCKNLSGD